MRVAVAAIFKNEAPYVLEWLAHHLTVGFTNFVIADNGSNDGTAELLAALQDVGLVQYVPFPTAPGVAPQMLAYEHLLDSRLSEFDWVAFIDADEFIKPSSGSIIDLLAETPTNCGGIILNWATFGSSGHLTQTPGGVIERFRCRAPRDFEVNRHFKSIVRPTVATIGANPHTFKLREGYHYVRGDGGRVDIPIDGTATVTSDVCWASGSINHYIVKSRQEFFSKKRPRGRGTITSLRPYSFFPAHDRNDEHEPVDYKWLGDVARVIEDIERRLTAAGYSATLGRPTPPQSKSRGSVDSALIYDNVLSLTGWALDANDSPGGGDIAVQVGGDMPPIHEIKITHRHDVVRTGCASNSLCGFEITVAHTLGLVPESAFKIYSGGYPIPLSRNFQVRRAGSKESGALPSAQRGWDIFDDICKLRPQQQIQTVFDVGANTGQTARKIRSRLPNCLIHTFEAIPSTFETLSKNTSGMNSVFLHNIALGRRSGTRLAMEAVPNSVDNRVITGDFAGPRFEAEIVAGDDFCRKSGISRIDYLKIDVTGHDLEVLSGFSGMMETSSIKFIEVEAGMNSSNTKHTNYQHLISYCSQFGYELLGIYDQIRELNVGTLLRRANLVFVSPSALES